MRLAISAPTRPGDMGSIGMAGSPKKMIQTAVGRQSRREPLHRAGGEGRNGKISPILRTAADMSGGFQRLLPQPAARQLCAAQWALGGISLALSSAKAITAAEKKGWLGDHRRHVKATGGTILVKGAVTKKDLVYTRRLSISAAFVLGEGDKAVTIHTMNEYMAIDDCRWQPARHLPDVIATLDAAGQPLSAGRCAKACSSSCCTCPRR